MDYENMPNVWLWKDPDLRWKNEILSYVRSTESSDKEVIVLHCSLLEDFFDSLSLTNYILNMCYMFDVFEDEKTMFLNSKDLILSIELCLKKLKNQNNAAESEISDGSITECHSAYVNSFQESYSTEDENLLALKDFIMHNNLSDSYVLYDKFSKSKNSNESLSSYLSGKKFVILGIPQSEIVKKFMCCFGGKEIFNVVVETPLDISLSGNPCSPKSSPPKINIVAEPMETNDIPIDDSTNLELGSATEEYAAEIIIAFLSLLINSRNELALSKTMISPIINFSHDAFTKLRHLASEKEMPMCQVAVSYVTRIKLGGKGYAPSSDCPMLPHLKSLELFVDILNQMQTMIEEDVKPEFVVKKLVIFLKKRLLKSGSEKLKATSVETAANNLITCYEKMPDLLKCNTSKSAPQICQESLDIIRSFVNYINCDCWIFEAENILCKRQTKRTPLNLPPLLGYFRSPEDESTCESTTVLNEDSLISSECVAALATSVSYFHHSDSSLASCVDSSTPTKINFKDCFPSENEVSQHKNEPTKKRKPKINVRTASKGRKRSILKEITNDDSPNVFCEKKTCPPKEKFEVDPVHSEKTTKEAIIIPTVKNIPKKNKKVPKTLKQVQGQVKITNFFITR